MPRLRAVLKQLNPDQPPEAIAAASEGLSDHHSSMALVGANQELDQLLKDGVLVSVADHERDGQGKERLRVINLDNLANNDFVAVNQFNVKGHRYDCWPNLVGFVNGLSL